jgi:gamma-glutamyl:cysteine ligase YbdK (ATP-grasp superfamily)
MSSRRSSVEPYRFGSSDPYTLGVEEEYMLLDAETLDLVQRADTILDADHDGEFAARTSCELFQSEIEGRTPICATVSDMAAELRRLRRHLEDAVGEHGLMLAAAGTHPFEHTPRGVAPRPHGNAKRDETRKTRDTCEPAHATPNPAWIDPSP